MELASSDVFSSSFLALSIGNRSAILYLAASPPSSIFWSTWLYLVFWVQHIWGMNSIISSTPFGRARGHWSLVVTNIYYLLFQESICSMKNLRTRTIYHALKLMGSKWRITWRKTPASINDSVFREYTGELCIIALRREPNKYKVCNKVNHSIILLYCTSLNLYVWVPMYFQSQLIQ